MSDLKSVPAPVANKPVTSEEVPHVKPKKINGMHMVMDWIIEIKRHLNGRVARE